MLSRIDGLEARTKAFDEVEQRVEAMLQTAGAAQEVAEKLMAPDGDLQKHRQQVQHLSSQTLETRASVEALAHERAVLEDLRKQIAQSKAETRQAIEAAGGLRGEIEQVRGTAGQLGQDYAKLRDTTRAAREDASVATAAVKDIESRLGPLMQLQNRSETTEDKLTALNALAEHVTQKAKALESQKHTIDRATVEANRLNEMVWAMDVQIGKLNEGLKKAARGRGGGDARRKARRGRDRPGGGRRQGAGRDGPRGRAIQEGLAGAGGSDARRARSGRAGEQEP